MRVFLTSSPCDDNVPEGVELPCIFFEKNSFVANLWDRVPPQARLTVVAADPDAFDMNDEMAETFAACFEYHDMPLSDVQLLDSRTAAYAEELVRGSDILLLGGGHVPTENAFFERIGLRELLEDYEGVVIGISAGSMNCAETVYAQPEMPGESIDPDYERFIPGLGIADINVLPHYQKARHYLLDGRRLYEDITFEDSVGHEFFAIPDSSYILIEDGCAVLFGEGYRIAGGEIEQICEDEGFIEL